MSRTLRLLMAGAFCVALSACTGNRKPPAPLAACPVRTEIVTVEKVRYVPIAARLTEPHPIAEGPLSHCPDVAAARRAELEKANAKLREIRAIQGTEAKP